MAVDQRPFSLPDDYADALALADCSGINVPHIADWPYRMSSWALGDPLNGRVWRDTSSRLLGWAIMQTPFWSIDCLVHPNAPACLYSDMLGWARARAVDMMQLGEGHPLWFVSMPEARLDCRNDLEQQGFEDISDAGEDAWSKVLFEYVISSPPQPAELPEGLQVRCLNPLTEIQAYVDLHRDVFQSKNMTQHWRRRAIGMDDYRNELDLVIASANGDLHGYCVAWLRKLATGETVGQIEPLGVRACDRGQGLSQALMAEAIRRLQDLGASKVFVETDKQRTAAMAAYASMGFHVAHDVRVYRYEVPTQ